MAPTFIDTLLSSQRTRTHHHRTPTNEHPVPGQPFQLIRSDARAQTRPPEQHLRSGPTTLAGSEHQSNSEDRQALPVQPRFPSLTCEDRVRVGVRVALTWNKLREPTTEHQIARSQPEKRAFPVNFRRRTGFQGISTVSARAISPIAART